MSRAQFRLIDGHDLNMKVSSGMDSDGRSGQMNSCGPSVVSARGSTFMVEAFQAAEQSVSFQVVTTVSVERTKEVEGTEKMSGNLYSAPSPLRLGQWTQESI